MILPLTSAQEAIYLAHLLDDSQIAYNIAHFRKISNDININLFSKAFDLVLAKTPSFRTKVIVNNGIPSLIINPITDCTLETLDFSTKKSPETIAEAWRRRRGRGV